MRRVAHNPLYAHVTVAVNIISVAVSSFVFIQFFQKSLKPAHESDPDALITAAIKVRYNVKKMKR